MNPPAPARKVYFTERLLIYNPLYKDATARNFKPTSRSPLRFSDGTDTLLIGDTNDHDIGYEAYAGDVTPGYQGFYWADYQFTPGTYTIEGDLVITGRKIPGSGPNPADSNDDVPARVTTTPGVTLKMATTDAMEGGRDSTRIEIMNHGTLEMDGITGMWVNVTSAAAAPKAGDWYGVVVATDAFGTNVSETTSSYALFGARLETNNHVIKNFEAHHCGTGIHVEGGAPEVNNVILHDNDYGLHVVNSTPKIIGLFAHHNNNQGLWLDENDGTTRALTVDGCMLYDNKTDGAYLYNYNAGLTTTFNRCTIAYNLANGLNVYRGYTAANATTLNNSVIASNTQYGIYGQYGYSTSYLPSVTWNYSDLWGNTSGQSTSVALTAGTGTFVYNPLFKDPANDLFAPTERSPLRCAHQDGTQAAGYAPYVGDPTSQLMGYLHKDMTLTADLSPYVIPGDLIVDNKCDTFTKTYANTTPIVMTDVDNKTSTINVADVGNEMDVDVTVNFTHADTSEVKLVLTAPDGTTNLVLADHGGGTNIVTTYDTNTSPYGGSMTKFANVPVNGNWTLNVIDDKSLGHAGTLNSWSLAIKYRTPPVVLTIQAGTVLKFAAGSDAMGGGQVTNRAELRVFDKVVVDGTSAQVALTSGAATPAKGDWTGVVLESGNVIDLKGYLVEWAQNGFQGVSTTGNKYSKGVVRNASQWGY